MHPTVHVGFSGGGNEKTFYFHKKKGLSGFYFLFIVFPITQILPNKYILLL